MFRLRPVSGLVLALHVVLAVALAQPSPRPLNHSDFDSWRSIATPMLSPDGKWLAYSFMPQDADGDLILREIATGKEHRVPVGALPVPVAAPTDENTNPEAPPPPRNIRITFTSDSRFAVASTHPAKADVTAARRAKKKPEEMPRDGLVMVSLASGEVTRVAEVKGFQVPAKGGAWVAYLKEPKPEDRKSEEGAGASGEKAAEPNNDTDGSSDLDDIAADNELAPGAAAEDVAPDTVDAAAPRRTSTSGSRSSGGSSPGGFGTELVLRDLAASTERTFDAVTDYTLARDGKTLLYAVSSKTTEQNGIYLMTPGDAAAPKGLLSGKGRYSRLAWDREQTQVAFVSDRDSAASSDTGGSGKGNGSSSGGPRSSARYKLYRWERGSAAPIAVVTAETPGLPKGLVVAGTASASFSRDGKKLYVPTAPPSRGTRPSANAIPDEEKVTADLWHWRDGFVQPMQKTRAAQDRIRSYRGVYDIAAKTYVQLTDVTMATFSPSDDGTRALGQDDRAYRPLVDYDGRFTDVYVVNPVTGARQLALKQLRNESGSALQWSPDGRWASYYSDRQWRLLDTATGTTRSLTAKMRVAFHNEQDDRPQPPGAYGAAGWTKDSASLLVYDRFDVWQLFVDERAPRNLTGGHGRAQKLQLRVQRIDPVDEDDDERGLDPAKTLILRGENEETRASGFFRLAFTGTAAPEQLLWGEKNYRYIGRANEADALLLTASRFDEFPDVHVTNAAFAAPQKLTDGGAQLAKFSWGRGEIVSFRSTDGTPLKAALYKPANFDPKKKYPLIVYIYERLSQNVHNFVNPAPGTSINLSFYVSNGYCVLTPDIVYKKGQPGQSALHCVLPALDAVVKQGFVDEKAVGIQGHSWGGYQIAYMVTQTERFRAAEAGAPVGNMTSAYSGIRWGSGSPRQFQYETGQSRIGQPLQAATKTYLDNSAIFQIEKVKTPLLILANDNDDAVPWQQGIELFLALRRYRKPAWLFNYNGEFHGLRRRPDQKDWTKRMQQYFDHYLKGAPAPKWLEEGIPYIEREEEKEKFNAPAKAEKAEPVAAGSTQ